MKLREYIKNLNEFVDQNPEALDLDVVAAVDDEGSGYNYIWATPSVGIDMEDYFIFHEDDVTDYLNDGESINVVCVN